MNMSMLVEELERESVKEKLFVFWVEIKRPALEWNLNRFLKNDLAQMTLPKLGQATQFHLSVGDALIELEGKRKVCTLYS
jgi:hypothetical protein